MSRAADYITKAFGATGASLSEQRYKAGPVETRNVIARFGLEARPRVVVGAHYDVYGDFPDQSAGPSPRTLGASGQVEFLGVDAPAVLRPLHGRPSSWKRVAVTADNFEPLPVDPLIARAGIAFRFGTP